MKIEKYVSNSWKYAQAKRFHLWTYKYAYIYSNKNARLSLIHLRDDYYNGKNWELYGDGCCGSRSNPDIERFKTKHEAETRAEEILHKTILTL